MIPVARLGMRSRHDRPLLWAAGATTATAAAGYWLPSAALVSASARRLFGVRATIASADAVALTFDDGPHPHGTPAVLAALERVGAPATFFLAGEQVERWPGLAADIAAAGHEVAVHCHAHRNLMWLTPRRVRDDLRRAAAVITRATGRPLRYYRPPYGILTTAALSVARQMGWEVILWLRDGRDWDARETPASIAGRIARKLEPGDVVLLHDADHYSAAGSWRRAAAAIERLDTVLEERNLLVASLDAAAPTRRGLR
jgi:peptidoglycan/xylan/chitin deacetylase (PgdA/CDA1 family)